MYCVNCGAKIDDNANFCISCGAKIENDVPMVVNAPDDVITEPNVTVTPVVEQPVEQEVVVEVGEPIIEQQPPKKKKKKWPVVLGVVMGVLAICVGVFFAFKDVIVFNAMKLMPADVQYKYVYNQAAKDMSKDITDAITSTRDMFSEEKTVEGDVAIELNEELLSLINEEAGIDVSDIREAKIQYKVTNKDGLTKFNFGIGNSKATIINAEICVDLKKQVVTMSVPELFSETVKVEIGEYASGTAPVIMELVTLSEDLLPSNELIEKLIPKYVEIIFSQIDDVRRSTTELTVDGVTQKVTKFTAIIDEDVIKDMLIAVLEAVKEDEDIKEYFTSTFKKVKSTVSVEIEGSAKDYWNDFCDMIDEARSEIKSTDFEKIDIDYITYTNYKGEIIGIECQAYFNGSEVADISIINVQRGDKMGFSVKLEINKSKVLEMEGSVVNKDNKLTGEIEVELIGIKFAEITITDFDIKGYSEGQPNGKIEIEYNNLNEFLPDSEIGDDGTSTNISIELNFSSDDSIKAEMIIRGFGIYVGSIKSTYKVSEAEDISIPSNTTDDLEKWAESLSFDKLQENLKRAEVYDFFEELFEQDDYEEEYEDYYGEDDEHYIDDYYWDYEY